MGPQAEEGGEAEVFSASAGRAASSVWACEIAGLVVKSFSSPSRRRRLRFSSCSRGWYVGCVRRAVEGLAGGNGLGSCNYSLLSQLGAVGSLVSFPAVWNDVPVRETVLSGGEAGRGRTPWSGSASRLGLLGGGPSRWAPPRRETRQDFS